MYIAYLTYTLLDYELTLCALYKYYNLNAHTSSTTKISYLNFVYAEL